MNLEVAQGNNLSNMIRLLVKPVIDLCSSQYRPIYQTIHRRVGHLEVLCYVVLIKFDAFTWEELVWVSPLWTSFSPLILACGLHHTTCYHTNGSYYYLLVQNCVLKTCLIEATVWAIILCMEPIESKGILSVIEWWVMLRAAVIECFHPSAMSSSPFILVLFGRTGRSPNHRGNMELSGINFGFVGHDPNAWAPQGEFASVDFL